MNIVFNINYHTSYGQNICVVGDHSILGSWNSRNSFLLHYKENGNWTGSIQFPLSSTQIQYKYVMIDTNNGFVLWEEGENRTLDLTNIEVDTQRIILNDIWNHRQVTIRVKNTCKPSQHMLICGEGEALGNRISPQKMDFVLKKDPITGTKEYFWEKVFNVHMSAKKLKYKFVIEDTEKNEKIWERGSSRTIYFNPLQKNASTVRSKSLVNQKYCLKIAQKRSKIIKYDSNFSAIFHYAEITKNIFLGPYPQSASDIDLLISKGVKAILNLQSDQDMIERGVDWEAQKKYYQEKGIRARNFCIIDGQAYDIVDKAHDAASVLKDLVSKYEVKFN